MEIYKARKGTVEFYIQPDAIKEYDELGYEIIKITEERVQDIEKEIQVVSENISGAVIETAEAKG